MSGSARENGPVQGSRSVESYSVASLCFITSLLMRGIFSLKPQVPESCYLGDSKLSLNYRTKFLSCTAEEEKLEDMT